MGLIGEFRAIMSSMQAYVDAHAAESGLMGALKEYMTTQPTEQEQEQLKQWASAQQEEMKANRPNTPEELQQRVRETVTNVMALLRGKGATEDEVSGFKTMMINIAEAVAEASKEGGFLGFGGVRVSDKEQSILTQIRAELG